MTDIATAVARIIAIRRRDGDAPTPDNIAVAAMMAHGHDLNAVIQHITANYAVHDGVIQ